MSTETRIAWETKNVLETPIGIIQAVKQNNESAFSKLLALKFNPEGGKIIDEVDAEYGGNALYWAAACGHCHFIVALAQATIDVNKPNKNGVTPMFIAAEKGHAK